MDVKPLPNRIGIIKSEPWMQFILPEWLLGGCKNINLDLAGLVVLADLSTVARRTAMTGTSFLLDALVLCPGLHRQQTAPELNGGEFPACAAMTTGYVFRVENPATVLYLQRIGRTGQLTTLSVSDCSSRRIGWLKQLVSKFYDSDGATLISTAAFFAAVALTLLIVSILLNLRDFWGVLVLAILVFARLVNVSIIRSRAKPGWFGAPEPGVQGDLLILLSQDRWIRMRGAVDDLKAVTSGRWLRDMSVRQNALVAFTTLVVYLDASLASNASQEGKLLLIILLCLSVALLGIANEAGDEFKIHGRIIKVDGRQPYKRRKDMADQLVRETGRRHWAVRLGMIVPEGKEDDEVAKEGPPTM